MPFKDVKILSILQVIMGSCHLQLGAEFWSRGAGPAFKSASKTSGRQRRVLVRP